MSSRTCSVCNITKEYRVWYAGPTCGTCRRRAWRKANPEKARLENKNWRRRNPEKLREIKARERDRNREAYAEAKRRYYSRHKDEVLSRTKERQRRLKDDPTFRADRRARVAARRASLRRGRPLWVDSKALREIYAQCPPGYEVDHIVPLQGKNVSGLHVPWNLQYLPAAENRRKGNKI